MRYGDTALGVECALPELRVRMLRKRQRQGRGFLRWLARMLTRRG
jgi:hypothetical protein